MHLREVRDRPHEIAARKGEQDARPDEPAPVLVVSFRFPRVLGQHTYVWLGPLGVVNHPTNPRATATARIKSVGREDDMVTVEG